MLIADRVFKRSVEGSEDHSRRSQDLSRSQKRKKSTASENPARFAPAAIADMNDYARNDRNTANDYHHSIPRKDLDTKDSKETGRFIDHENSRDDKPKQSLRPKTYGSPLRNKNDPSRHQPLWDKQMQPVVDLGNRKCDDSDLNALNRFEFIHRQGGDTFDDLTRDQRFAKHARDEDEFGYRRLNSDLIKSGEETRREMARLKQKALHGSSPSPQRKDYKHIEKSQAI